MSAKPSSHHERTPAELKEAGYTILQLSEAGCSMGQLLQAGYTVEQLKRFGTRLTTTHTSFAPF